MTEVHVTERLRSLRMRAGIPMSGMAKALGLRGTSGYQRYEDAAVYRRGYLRLEWAPTLRRLFVGQGDPPIIWDDVAILFAHGVTLHPTLGLVVPRDAVEAAERVVAQAGPLNATPRDVVRRIFGEVLGLRLDNGGES